MLKASRGFLTPCKDGRLWSHTHSQFFTHANIQIYYGCTCQEYIWSAGWTAVKSGTDIDAPLRMNPPDFPEVAWNVSRIIEQTALRFLKGFLLCLNITSVWLYGLDLLKRGAETHTHTHTKNNNKNSNIWEKCQNKPRGCFSSEVPWPRC